MEQMMNYRHNVMSVNTIEAFKNIIGGINKNYKDVYFVRALGTNTTYIEDIKKMDDALIRSMNSGTSYYKRTDGLPKLQRIEDTEFYSDCYLNWLNSGKKSVKTKVSAKHNMLAETLGNACAIIEKMYMKETDKITDSMIKNFIVKLLFWYDSVFADERFEWQNGKNIKIVVTKIEKKQEYLFCYLMTLTGCDVLLLQSKSDISSEEEALGLSKKFVLGDYAEISIPEYQWYNTVNSQPRQQESVEISNTSNRITVKIPKRERPGRASQAIPERTVVNNNVAPRREERDTDTEKSFEELAQLASSIVMIYVYNAQGERIGSGSGIMIGRDGYILTNNHVACGGKFYTVRIEDDEREYKTEEVIKYHSILDLAIIRIQRILNPLPVYNGKKPLVRGQKVVAIGSPLGLFNSVSNGIISGFRKFETVDMIQFTAPISRGSSGGAVLNMQGEVIGISTAGIDEGQNINLAMGYECINMFIKGFI